MLSARTKKALKTSIAVVIAYAIALYMNWEKPYWAAWTAFSISLATRGEGIQKGFMRLVGGLIGAIAGLALLAFFVQERWLFITFLSLYGAVFTYLALGSRGHGYFWQQAGFFCTVVAFDSAFNPANAFGVGIERAQETGAGLVTYVVVSLLLWPEHSRRDLEQTASRLSLGVRQLWEECKGLMAGVVADGGHPGLPDQIRALQAQLGRFLGAAETDSLEVEENRSAWRSYQAQTAGLAEMLARSRSDLDELEMRDLERVLPALPAYNEEIDRRLADIERMLAGNRPADRPRSVALAPDVGQLGALSYFERAAVTVQHDRLLKIEVLTREIFDSLSLIRDADRGRGQAAAPGPAASLRPALGSLSLDRDHLEEALRVAFSIWLMFLTIVYIPGVPAGLGALGIATRIAFADSAMPALSVTTLFRPVVVAVAGTFPFYFLLLPQLSTYPELATAVFLVAFSLVYGLNEPRQALTQTILAYLFFSVIGVSNEQTYSFSHYSTTLMMWLIILSVLTIAEYIPISHAPEHVFLRLLNRFFRSCEFLLHLGRVPQCELSLRQRMRIRFHTYEVATIPAKLAQWGRSLPPDARGASTPDQVQDYVKRLGELSARMQTLLEARSAPQAAVLVRQLRPDIRVWRTGVEGILRTLAVEPQSADHGDLQSRLRSTLARLEARIRETLNGTDTKAVAADEFGDMYRLLSAHRGVSDSLVRLTEHAGAIDWERLRESRF